VFGRESKIKDLMDRCGLTEEDLKNPYLMADIEENLDLMDFYGLCPVHLDNLSTYDHFVRRFGEPFPYLGKDEPSWEYVITFTAKDQYAKIADWTIEMAFREILQNALDGANELGYSSDDVKIEYDDERGLLVVENPSKRLSYEHMVFGGSEKPCWTRGRYGEGLKVASSFFTKRRGTIYVISHDVAFRFISVQKYIVLLLGRAKRPIAGKTAVYIHDKGAKKLEDMVDVVLFKTKGRKFAYKSIVNGEDYGCKYDAECHVAEKEREIGSLYVRDMYVNNFKELAGNDSLFDYNLWWLNLSRDRIHITSTYELYSQIAEVLDSLDEKSMEKIAGYIVDKCTRIALSHGGFYIVFGGNFVELTAISDNYYRTYDLRKAVTKKIIEKYKLKENFVGYDTSASWVDRALYLGYTPVIYTSPTSNPPFVLPLLFDLIKEHSKKATDSLKEHRFTLDDIDRNLMETIISNYNAWTLKWLLSALGFVKMFAEIFPLRGLGMSNVYFTTFDDKPELAKGTIALYYTDENSIYFGVDRIKKYYGKMRPFDVAAEECIHAFTKAGDVSADFEKYLIEYLNDYFTKILEDKLYMLKHNMAKSGFYKYLVGLDYLKLINSVTKKAKVYYTHEYRSYHSCPPIMLSGLLFDGTVTSLANITSEAGTPPVFVVSDDSEKILLFNWFNESALTMYYLGETRALARYVKDSLERSIAKTGEDWIRDGRIHIVDYLICKAGEFDYEEV